MEPAMNFSFLTILALAACFVSIFAHGLLPAWVRGRRLLSSLIGIAVIYGLLYLAWIEAGGT
jgi:hypothetical protein